MNNWIPILPFLILISCSHASDHEQRDDPQEQANYFENASKVELFGDSLRVEYEIHGDTVIQHRIDLKGKKGDGFDDSFTVTSIWVDRIPSRLDCKNKIEISSDSLEFWFCTSQVIDHYDSLIRDPSEWDKGYLTQTRTRLGKIRNEALGRIEATSIFMPLKLAMKLDFQLVDSRTNDTTSKLLIENYDTEFSGGKNFYIVNSKNDTTARFHMNEFMR